MNVEEQEKRLLDYKWHERRYSKDTCYILSTQGTEEPNIICTLAREAGISKIYQCYINRYNELDTYVL